jgi:putative ABC transport system substrate-binding protein
VDVIVVPIQVRAAKRLVKTIPIVMISTIDPVGNSLVDKLAHPGGNITGFSTLGRELSGKRLELAKEVAPKTNRVGILRNPDDPSNSDDIMKEFELTARGLEFGSATA